MIRGRGMATLWTGTSSPDLRGRPLDRPRSTGRFRRQEVVSLLRRRSAALAVIALVVTLSGCSGSASGSATSTRGAVRAGEGYLFAGPSEAIFLTWQSGATPITGTVDWRRTGSARITADFSITMGTGSFSFDFAPGSIAGWTGSYAGDGLELLIPADAGGLRAIALRPATQAEFETIAAQLK